MVRQFGCAVLALALAISSTAGAAEPNSTIDWAGEAFGGEISAPTIGGAVTVDDLLRLRDIGGFSLSPNGRWLAFSVYQAVPERNDYALRWFIQPTDGSRLPMALSQDGGQPMPAYSYGLPQAYVPSEIAKWSPDGTKLAFRRMIGRRIELWVANLSDRRSMQVVDGAAQVDAFVWTPSGALLFRTGLNHDRYEAAVAAEARHGWLSDGRTPLFAARAKPTEPDCSTTPKDPACDIKALAWEGARIRPATATEFQMLKGGSDLQIAPPITAPSEDQQAMAKRRADGGITRLEIVDPREVNVGTPLRRLVVETPRRYRCNDRACAGSYFKSIGWARGGRTVWFLKYEDSAGREDGAPKDVSALYEWRPGAPRARRIASAGLFDSCSVYEAVAYCLREEVTRPRQIVAIDLDSGAMRTLADPNPAFATKAYPAIEKRRVVDPDGNPGYAYVVYPNNYTPGQRYPLVITQYRQRGFLRGQVGNEYPIFPLAASGMVVVSLDRPEDYNLLHEISYLELNKRRLADNLHDRRRVLGAIESLVDGLVSDGLVDNGRVALTGLSAGAETTHYALQHTDRFAAAITSSGAHDISFLALLPEGSWRTLLMDVFGADRVIPTEGNALQALAWSRMPERLKTPLLVNTGENESMIGFEGLEALKHAKRPLEVRVFPGETHIKYHPQSIAGVYENNMMWLRFWLQGYESPAPEFEST